MNFKKWYINEVGTGTNCVAVFAQRLGAPVTREWPPSIAGSKEDDKKSEEDEPRKKK